MNMSVNIAGVEWKNPVHSGQEKNFHSMWI